MIVSLIHIRRNETVLIINYIYFCNYTLAKTSHIYYLVVSLFHPLFQVRNTGTFQSRLGSEVCCGMVLHPNKHITSVLPPFQVWDVFRYGTQIITLENTRVYQYCLIYFYYYGKIFWIIMPNI